MRTYEFTVWDSTAMKPGDVREIAGTMTLDQPMDPTTVICAMWNVARIIRLVWYEQRQDDYAAGCLLCKDQLTLQGNRGVTSWCKRHKCRVPHAD